MTQTCKIHLTPGCSTLVRVDILNAFFQACDVLWDTDRAIRSFPGDIGRSTDQPIPSGEPADLWPSPWLVVNNQYGKLIDISCGTKGLGALGMLLASCRHLKCYAIAITLESGSDMRSIAFPTSLPEREEYWSTLAMILTDMINDMRISEGV